jgi:hypothetical protein
MVGNWDDWRRMRHSMALEGWIIPEERLVELACEYEANGIGALAEKIARTAEECGRPLAKVAEELLREFRKRRDL